MFGMRIAALRRRENLFIDDTSVDEAFAAASDYVLVATPLTPETLGLVGEAAIAAMKSTAVLHQRRARGPVVDEPALVRALQSGTLRGAALDVFAVEQLLTGRAILHRFLYRRIQLFRRQ